MTTRISKCLLLLPVFLFCFGFSGFSAKETSADKKNLPELNRKVSDMIEQSPEKALALGIEVLKLADEAGNKAEKAYALKNLGNIHYYMTNYRQSLEYFEQALFIYKQIEDKDGIASTLNNSGLILEIQGDYSGALKRYIEASTIFSKIENEKKLALSYTNIGNVYYSLGRFDKSLNYLSQALRIHEKTNDSTGLSKSFNNIGNVYLSLKDYKIALDYYHKAEFINKRQNNLLSLSTSYTNLGSALQGLGNIDEALEYNRLSIEISRRINDNAGIISSLLNIGNIYQDEGNLSQSLINYKEALRLLNNNHDSYLQASVLSKMASLKIKQKELDEAISLLNEALTFADKTRSDVLLEEIYGHLANAWNEKGDFKRAYVFLRKHKTYTDSIYNLESNERLNRLRVSFESEQTERDNQLLRQQNIFSQLALKRQQIIRNLLIAISVIIIVFSTFLLSMYQSKKRKNELLAESNQQIIQQKEELNLLYKEQYKQNETKNKFFSIVAHDLKSPFQSILGFSELLSSEYEYLFRSFNVRDLVLETLPVFQSPLKKKNIQLTYDLPPLLQAWADPDMIMAVLRNLISNAIKFTPVNGNIHLSATQADDMVRLAVKDTGTGMSSEILERLFTFDPKVQRAGTMGERGTGLGLALCLEFMELNHGIIKVESELEKGSTFTMMMQPLTRRPRD
ncbi:MAG: Two-component system-sensor histidine kinase [Bacteroidetes bacterium]|nr:MAG: Two-component system-sensor histidine kinase [Bacteroidota bacterium]